MFKIFKMQPQNLFVLFATFLCLNIVFYIKSRVYSVLDLDWKIYKNQKHWKAFNFLNLNSPSALKIEWTYV